MNNILIIEDEAKIRRVIKDYLNKEGFEVLEACDGESGIKLFEQNKERISLIVLDIMLPKKDGFQVCKEIRKISNVLIVMVTAKFEEEDTLFGYELGADDYVTKPFSVKVLIAKIKALLKLKEDTKQPIQDENVYKFGNIKVDNYIHQVYCNNNKLPLTKREYDLLLFFIKNKNIALSRQQIVDEVWGVSYEGEDRVVDTCVKRLRAKIGKNNDFIQAVWGYGYRFEVDM